LSSDELLKKIGELTVERDFLAARAVSLELSVRRGMIVRDHDKLPVRRQSGLLQLCRSTVLLRAHGPSLSAIWR
jgi:hypothetical protein